MRLHENILFLIPTCSIFFVLLREFYLEDTAKVKRILTEEDITQSLVDMAIGKFVDIFSLCFCFFLGFS